MLVQHTMTSHAKQNLSRSVADVQHSIHVLATLGNELGSIFVFVFDLVRFYVQQVERKTKRTLGEC